MKIFTEGEISSDERHTPSVFLIGKPHWEVLSHWQECITVDPPMLGIQMKNSEKVYFPAATAAALV